MRPGAYGLNCRTFDRRLAGHRARKVDAGSQGQKRDRKYEARLHIDAVLIGGSGGPQSVNRASISLEIISIYFSATAGWGSAAVEPYFLGIRTGNFLAS